LILYSTTEWSLLQSLACFELYKEGFIEPVSNSDKPFDILLHQILSIVKETSGCSIDELMRRISNNFAFSSIPLSEVQLIIDHLLSIYFLESIEREIIIGIEGEKVVNSKDFYSVFKSEPNLKILHSGRRIGEIPFSPQVKIDENILLAAKIWKIRDIDFDSNKIEVIPANDGKKPIFSGSGGTIHYSIREKMLNILVGNSESYPELDENSNKVIASLRKEFSNCHITNLLFDRPYIDQSCCSIEIFTFQSTRVNRSLHFLAEKLDLNPILTDSSSSIKFGIENFTIADCIERLNLLINNIDDHLEDLIRSNPSLMDFTKWGLYVPERFQIEILKEKYFDFPETQKFLENIKLVHL
jgi:ATP-dependent Lhr-like helicase